MKPGRDRQGPRPIGNRILLTVAITAGAIGGFVLVATALGYGRADVRGMRLEGGLKAIFLAGLGTAVAGAIVAAIGLARRRRWAPQLLAAVWPTFALVTLLLDRLTPAPGPGRPLAFYVVGIGLLPAAVTWLLGRTDRSER